MTDRDEWATDISHMTETERYLAVEEPRWAIGLIGDKDDDL